MCYTFMELNVTLNVFLIVGNWLNKMSRGDEIGFTAIIRS